MTTPEKVGRAAWVAYVILAAPLALFCAAVSFASLAFLNGEDIGPVEVPAIPLVQKAIIWSSMVSLPILWILGITIGHRFNGGKAAFLPFVCNLLPVGGLFWLALVMLRDEEGGEFLWITCYVSLLSVMLVVGIVTVIVSMRQNPLIVDNVPEF